MSSVGPVAGGRQLLVKRSNGTLMLSPYLVMAALYAGLALLAALEASLASFGWVPWFTGLRWLRVHFINLGVLTQLAFGAAPLLMASRAGRSRPATRWDIWGMLNAALLILFVGVPLVSAPLIIAGTTLFLLATASLLFHLYRMRAETPEERGRGLRRAVSTGRPFYLAGLAFLLLGAFLGAGIWLGWGAWLRIDNVKEIHVHANLWGFAALVWAGLIIDLYPEFAGRSLANPRAITPVFWLMASGAFGLVLGPWIRVEAISSLGLVAHTLGTVWLLAIILRPLVRVRAAWTPGLWHLLSAYAWFLIPSTVAPMIVANAAWFPVSQVVSNGGPILIYGWLLQLAYALLPYLLAQATRPGAPGRLGGNWLTLGLVHLGAILFWIGLFFSDWQGMLHGLAFGLWVVSLVPIVRSLWQSLNAALPAVEAGGDGALPADEAPDQPGQPAAPHMVIERQVI